MRVPTMNFYARKAAVRIHYCAEPFNNEEEGITVTLIKFLKRAMVGETTS